MFVAPRTPWWALSLALAWLIPQGAQARPQNAEDALHALAKDRAEGRVSEEASLLEAFRLVFAPDRVSARYQPENHGPVRCLTPTIVEFEAAKSRLSRSAVQEIEGYLTPKTSGLRAVYFSPGGKFQLTYDTVGANAPPSTDTTPANGIPDFVERCAQYFDYSWTYEIDTLGFRAPALPGDGTYDVFFANMGAYGFTSVAGTTTEITIENNFVGFPPNDDPDGDQLGAAKVTIAHEFKHASQFTNNAWSEGGWVELDATWMEDIAYDAANDYYNYINPTGSQSQLVQPWAALDAGGTGSYEDCLWQHYLSEKHGNQFIVDLYDRRRTIPSENMKTSYSQILGTYGSSWEVAYPEFMEWCWFTGSRAEAGFGFGESTTYRRMELRDPNVAVYPFTDNDNVDQISGHPRRFNPGNPTLSPRVQFDGLDGHATFVVSVIVKETAGAFTVTHPTLGAGNVADYTVPLPWSAISYVGVIVTNAKRTGGPVNYSLTVSETASATGIETSFLSDPERLSILPNSPNPFTTNTAIRFAVPRATRGSLKVVDVAGRVVRTLLDGTIERGANEVKWDATNHAGKRVPAGVYWARLETADGSDARKMLRIQ